MLHFSKVVNNDELIEPGQYEVTLNADWKEASTGTVYINCAFKIRKDVQQNFGGRLVFDPIFKSKTNGEYSPSKINAILAAIPNSRQDFETYDDLILYINNTNMIVEIDIQKADPLYPNSKDRNIIKYLSYMPTVAGPLRAEESSENQADNTKSSEGLVEIEGAELAF